MIAHFLEGFGCGMLAATAMFNAVYWLPVLRSHMARKRTPVP